jgi:hypothetical protein
MAFDVEAVQGFEAATVVSRVELVAGVIAFAVLVVFAVNLATGWLA